MATPTRQTNRSDDFGEILEKVQAVATPKPIVRTLIKTPPPVKPALPKRDLSGLDWLEKMAPQPKQTPLTDQAEEQKKKQEIDRLTALDKKRSIQMYEEIQRQIQLIRKRKLSEPTKAITGATGYNPEQHEDPESFWDKMKKKKEALKKKLPWTSKQGMGTGEITRGVSG